MKNHADDVIRRMLGIRAKVAGLIYEDAERFQIVFDPALRMKMAGSLPARSVGPGSDDQPNS